MVVQPTLVVQAWRHCLCIAWPVRTYRTSPLPIPPPPPTPRSCWAPLHWSKSQLSCRSYTADSAIPPSSFRASFSGQYLLWPLTDSSLQSSFLFTWSGVLRSTERTVIMSGRSSVAKSNPSVAPVAEREKTRVLHHPHCSWNICTYIRKYHYRTSHPLL